MRVDELNDETEARMDAMEDRIRALETERDAAVRRAEEADGELDEARVPCLDGQRVLSTAERIRILKSALSEAQAREGRLRTDLREWATPPTGMGASLYAETWPALTPSARRRMLRLADPSPSPASATETTEGAWCACPCGLAGHRRAPSPVSGAAGIDIVAQVRAGGCDCPTCPHPIRCLQETVCTCRTACPHGAAAKEGCLDCLFEEEECGNCNAARKAAKEPGKDGAA